MELTKTVAENLGKVFLHIGQGMILGAFLSGFLGSEMKPAVIVIVFLLGGYTVNVGLYFVWKSTHLKD